MLLPVLLSYSGFTALCLSMDRHHRDLLAANPRVLQQPEPVIRVLSLGDSSVQIAVRPWATVPDYNAASSEVTQAVLETFRDRGIAIPFPQREVRLLGNA